MVMPRRSLPRGARSFAPAAFPPSYAFQADRIGTESPALGIAPGWSDGLPIAILALNAVLYKWRVAPPSEGCSTPARSQEISPFRAARTRREARHWNARKNLKDIPSA